MTDEQLAEIKARAGAAHDGPWGIPPARSNATKFWLQPYKERGDWSDPSWRGFVTCDFKEDAEFVAHAREDIPALLAALEAARAELSSETRWAKQYHDEAEQLRAENARLREAVTFNADQVTQGAHENAIDLAERLRAENTRLTAWVAKLENKLSEHGSSWFIPAEPNETGAQE